MDINHLTDKTQEALQAAQSEAEGGATNLRQKHRKKVANKPLSPAEDEAKCLKG
jgi:hypothetical protein